jgi:hypothetical protein
VYIGLSAGHPLDGAAMEAVMTAVTKAERMRWRETRFYTVSCCGRTNRLEVGGDGDTPCYFNRQSANIGDAIVRALNARNS